MHSNLTRAALWRLTSRAPLIVTQAPSSHGLPCCQFYLARVPKIQSRSLFSFFQKPQQPSLKAPERRPGFSLMVELHQRQRLGQRTPAPAKLAKGFGDFFRWHLNQAYALEDTEVDHVLATYIHLRDSYKEDHQFGLSDEVLRLALEKLVVVPDDESRYGAHVQLAEALFEELLRRRGAASDEEQPEVLGDKVMTGFIQILSQCGYPRRARSLIEENWHAMKAHNDPYALWLWVIEGLAKEKATEEIINTIEVMQKQGLAFKRRVHQCITSYYAQRQNVELTKKWYEHPIADGELPTKKTVRAVLRLCIEQDELHWGDRIFKSMVENNLKTLGDWSIVFQWALAQGKSVDEVERMMNVMVRRGGNKEVGLQPDSKVINGLIRTAIIKNDAYLAERCVALGNRWGITSDALTYLYQIEYRVKVGDLDGAQSAYQQLRQEDMEEPKNLAAVPKLAPVLNKLVRARCAHPQPYFDGIMRLVEDMRAQKAPFETETVCALAGIHLQLDDLEDLIDLINTHVLPRGLKQRASVRDVLIDFCLHQPQTISRMWDTYNILRHLFPELDVQTRTKFMNEFFQRGRSDMACRVFGHMRQQDVAGPRPTVDTYVACFEGIGRAGDTEMLELVHNMLKLDHQIDPCTRLSNGLMLAYMGCEDPDQSLQFWADIMNSREGPTYRSIEIALRACRDKDWGDENARGILTRLRRYKVELTKEICAAYVGALAGSGRFDECVRVIKEFQISPGYSPDALM